jgi:hypothetical protein
MQRWKKGQRQVSFFVSFFDTKLPAYSFPSVRARARSDDEVVRRQVDQGSALFFLTTTTHAGLVGQRTDSVHANHLREKETSDDDQARRNAKIKERRENAPGSLFSRFFFFLVRNLLPLLFT